MRKIRLNLSSVSTFFAKNTLIILSSIFVIDLCILLPQANMDPEPHHDGVMLAPAIAVSEGRIPNRDVFSQYGPLAPILQGIWLHIFGNKLINLRILTVLLISITAVLVYVLTSKFIGKRLSVLLHLLWVLSMPKLPLPPALPWASVISTLLILVSIYLFRKAESYSNDLHSIFLGTLTGILLTSTILLRIQMIYASAILVVFYSIRYFTNQQNRLLSLSFAVSSFLHFAFIFCLMKKLNILNAYLLQCFIWPKKFYADAYAPATFFTKSGFIYWSMWYFYPLFFFLILHYMRFKFTTIRYRRRTIIFSLFPSLIILITFLTNLDIKNKSYANPLMHLQWIAQRVPTQLNFYLAIFGILLIWRKVSNHNRVFSFFEMIILFSALLQLYPGGDPHHLWWISPVLFVVIFRNLNQNSEITEVYLRKIFNIAFFSSILSIVLLIIFLQNERVSFQSYILSGMKGDPNVVNFLDQTITTINSQLHNHHMIFDCRDGLYSVSNGTYLPKSRNFVNWGPEKIELPKKGDLVFRCNVYKNDIYSPSYAQNAKLVAEIKSSNGSLNLIYEITR